jgi:GTPase SAR1 family protein
LYLGQGDDQTPIVPPSSEGEKTFLFVGEKGSGKSSLIAKFLGDPVKEDMPETIALDFKFGKKNQDEKN